MEKFEAILYFCDSTMEVEYFLIFEVAKEVVWLWKFLFVPLAISPLVLFCDNSGIMV